MLFLKCYALISDTLTESTDPALETLSMVLCTHGTGRVRLEKTGLQRGAAVMFSIKGI